MKRKNEWLTKEKAFTALDGLLEDPAWVLGNFTAHEAAKALDLSANTTFYKHFYDWMEARLSKASSTGPVTDTQVEAELRQASQHFLDLIVNSCVSLVRQDRATAIQAADLRVATEQRSKAAMAEDRLHILDKWAKTEDELQAASCEVAYLRQQIAAKDAEIAQLRARLDERAAIVKGIEMRTASSTPADVRKPEAAAEAATPSVGKGGDRPAAARQSEKTAREEAGIFGFTSDDRPSASESDHPTGSQSELPLAISDRKGLGKDR